MSTPHGPGYSSDYGLPGYNEHMSVAVPAKIETAKVAAEEPTTRKRKTLKDLVDEFAAESTAHGIPRIITSTHWWAKLFWLVLACFLAGVFIYQGYGLLYEFLVLWPYSTKIDIITKKNVDFPAVTVCNMNRMKRSQLIGTRFQGIIDVDGGFDLDSGDYSWFWDFSSTFYEDFYSDWTWSSGPGGGSSAGPSAGPSSSLPAPGRKKRSAVSSASSSVGAGPSSVGAGPSSFGAGPSSFGAGPSSFGAGPSSFGAGPSSFGAGPSSWGAGPSSWGAGPSSFGPFPSYGYGYGPGIYSWLDPGAFGDDLNWDAWDSFAFEYDNYYDWDVAGESDWDGFYAQSKADDYSDIVDIANPTREELKNYGHQAEDFILQCSFDKRNCNYTDFRMFQNNNYGNCFTFNHGMDDEEVRQTSKSGLQYGLHLTLFIEQPEYVGIFSPETGVRVSVQAHDQQPHPEDNGITATTGQATSIAMRQNKITRLVPPHGKCSRNSETFSSEVFEYSVLSCEKQCLQQQMYERCGCVSDILLDEEKCSYLNSTQQRCKQLVQTLYNENKLECDCPDACEEFSYPLSTSSALWPSDKYEQHLYARVAEVNDKAAKTLQDVESTRKNVVRLRVFFEELNYQHMEQQKVWTIAGISGAVGGLMGLYLGISAVSFVEILLFLLKVLIYIFSCGKCTGTVHPE